MSSQQPSAADLFVSSDVSRVPDGDQRCSVAQAAKFAGIEESLRELRSGRMIVIADDEDRENEGDLMIAAEMVTPEVINFVATYERGLIYPPGRPPSERYENEPDWEKLLEQDPMHLNSPTRDRI